MIKRLMPKSLFARTLLILAIPTVLVQVVTTYVFYDRHWQTLARRLSSSLGGDIAFVANLVEKTPPQERTALIAKAAEDLHMHFQLTPRTPILPAPEPQSLVDAILYQEIDARLDNNFNIDLQSEPDWVQVTVAMDDGNLIILANKNRLFSYTSNLVILWMTGSSILLFGIAAIFMRNQIRPIRKLAEAAEHIGKGQEVVGGLKPSGAVEIREVTVAFRIMRDRIKRQIQQRTEMLAGISHDLRTPLTRMKLGLAMMPQAAEIEALQSDVEDMRQMVDAYLDFARGVGEEEDTEVDLSALAAESVRGFMRDGRQIGFQPVAGLILPGRPHALRRCLDNLIGNACRYGQRVEVSMQAENKGIDIAVEDDGPGIDSAFYEEVFKPFRRLDDSRNSETGGVGLGLSIARDIARGHGGDIILSRSKLGGLKAVLHLPV